MKRRTPNEPADITYTVYYRGDGWQYQHSHLVQSVRQHLFDGRILIVDLWKSRDSARPIIVRITLEDLSNEPRTLSNGITVRLSSRNITLVQIQEQEVNGAT